MYLSLHLKKTAILSKISKVMIIHRDKYLKRLILSQGNGLIKIITGIRRCGKSYLLFKLFVNHLKEQGIDDEHIIRIDLEDFRNANLHEPMALINYIDSKIKDAGQYYVLLDEVQYVKKFEHVLNSYLKIENVDVYVTGSNSKFLSSDIATEFRGRGDEIHLNPLSFSEFYSAKGGEYFAAWQEYITYGGLPQIFTLADEQKKEDYLKNVFQTVYLRDLLERNSILKSDEFSELVSIMASSIGSPCNATKLSNTFKTVSHKELTSTTISNYLGYMEDAYLIERSFRYDIKGKKYINSLSKYYFSDIGVRNAILGFRQQEETHIMENIIYNELRSRGFSVDVGVIESRSKNDAEEWVRRQLEVDFVVNRGSKRYYIQSAFMIPDKEKMQQESASLKLIRDAFKKIIIVRDYVKPWYTEDGILIIGLFDFLLNPESINY